MKPVADLDIAMGGRAVLHGVSFSAVPGALVALAGPNGAGKSTLLRALAGLIGPHAPDPRHVAYLPQGARCAWGLTVRQVVALGRLPWGGADPRGAVQSALDSCGIAQLAASRIDRLSGGQARRAMLARALAGEPETLLLDEPVADLDPSACHAIMRLLRRFADGGGTVVAVLHALDLAAAYATRLVVLEAGRIVADGPPQAVLPDAARAFGMALHWPATPLLLPLDPP